MPGGSAYTSAAITPGTRPTLNKAIDGNQVDELGHRLHHVEERPQRSLNAVALRRPDPDRDRDARRRGIAATITWLSVSIAMSHIPRTPMAAMHRNDTIDSARLREAAHAASAAPPHTIHHGRPSRRLRSGSSA